MPVILGEEREREREHKAHIPMCATQYNTRSTDRFCRVTVCGREEKKKHTHKTRNAHHSHTVIVSKLLF